MCVMSKTQTDKMEEEEGNGGEACRDSPATLIISIRIQFLQDLFFNVKITFLLRWKVGHFLIFAVVTH